MTRAEKKCDPWGFGNTTKKKMRHSTNISEYRKARKIINIDQFVTYKTNLETYLFAFETMRQNRISNPDV